MAITGKAQGSWSPLANGLPLEQLYLNISGVSDPPRVERYMRLWALHVGNTGVTDLTPLKGMPLTDLALHGLPLERPGPAP